MSNNNNPIDTNTIPSADDWIELHNVVPSDPSMSTAIRPEPGELSPQSKPIKRPPLPRLRIETSQAEPAKGDDQVSSGTEAPPQSAILGLAKGANLKIDNWLADVKPAKRDDDLGLTPSKSISGNRRPSNQSAALRSPLSPASSSMVSKSEFSPDRRAVSARSGGSPPMRRMRSPHSPGPARPRTPIPQLTLTVERSFQKQGEDTPLVSSDGGYDVDKNVFDDVNEEQYGPTTVINPPVVSGVDTTMDNSSQRSDDEADTSVASIHTESSHANVRPTNVLLSPLQSHKRSRPDINRSTDSLSPTNVETMRRPSAGKNAAPPQNLILSGVAFTAQQDFLDAEEEGRSIDDEQRTRNNSVSSGGRRPSTHESVGTDDESSNGTEYESEKAPRLVVSEPIGRTLFYFESDSALRRILLRLLNSLTVQYIEIILTLVQVVGICVEVWSPFKTIGGLPSVLNRKVMWVFIALYTVFTLLGLSRCIAFGVFTNHALTWPDIKRRLKWTVGMACYYASLRSIKPPMDYTLSSNPHSAYNCWLRKSWGRVDFISIVFFWAMTGVSTNQRVNSLDLIIAGMGHLRILRLLDEFTYTRVVLHVLKTAIPFLTNVLIFIGFFLAVWGVTGLQSFNGSLRRVCIYDEIITSQNCGSWLDPDTLKPQPYLLLDSSKGTFQTQNTSKGYTCPVGSKCVELRAFPPYGSYSSLANQSFDNIFNALEIVFIMLSNNGFTPIMYDIIDSEYMASSLFFIIGVLILGIWLMNLLVAVMVSSYASVRTTFDAVIDDSALVKMTRQIWNCTFRRLFRTRSTYVHTQPDAQIERLEDSQGSTIISDPPVQGVGSQPPTSQFGKSTITLQPALPLVDHEHQSVSLPPGSDHVIEDEDDERREQDRASLAGDTTSSFREKRDHGNWIFQNTKWGRRYSLIYPLFAVLAFVDLVVQACRKSPNDGLFGWELGLAIAFGIDIILRFWVLLPYWRYFFFSFMNLFDLMLAIANCVILAFYEDNEAYSWLTAFQLLRVYRLIGSLKYARVFWTQVFGNFKALMSLTAFFFLCTFFCTLVALKMLRGQFPMESEGDINEYSFYDLSVGFFNMYIVASTEDWTNVLFWVTNNVSRPGDNAVGLACMGILFCGWLFFANFLIFNLFLGIMSESLHGAIANKREEQVRQFFEEICESNLSHRGPLFGEVLGSFGPRAIYDVAATQHVKVRDKIVAFFMRFYTRYEQPGVISQSMRSAIERQFVVEFLEAHGNLEEFTGGRVAAGNTFLSLKMDASKGYGFQNYADFPLVLKCKQALKKVYSWLHHYPYGYRKYLIERLEQQTFSAENSRKAVVESMFDYNTHTMEVLDEYCENDPKFDCTLFIFSSNNKFRQFCQKLVPPSNGPRRSKVYPNKWVNFWVRSLFLMATISLVVQTCINTPLVSLSNDQMHGDPHWNYARVVDVVYGSIFTVELFVKVVADGFHFTPNAYTWSIWNCLDFLVLISIWMTFISDLANGPLSRYLRAFIALRALRLISFFQDSEIFLSSVFRYGLRNILGACLIGLSILIPYSVWGKNIFHDRLQQCNDDDTDYLSQCTGEYVSTVFDNFNVLAPRVVQEQYFNYNNFWEALMIQFGVLSLEGWVDVLEAVTSITGPGQQPSTYASTGNGAYPILFHYIGAVLIMTMLVAVIIRNYALTMGTAFLTEQQLSWLDVKRTLRMLKPTPKPPQYKYGSTRHKLLTIIPTWINSIELWALFVGTVDMAAYFYPLQTSTQDVYELILVACSLLLVLLSILRLIVLQPTLYFHNLWNLYGLVVCLCVTVLTIVNIALPEYKSAGALAASRAADICMLLLWIPRTKKLYQFFTISTAALGEISMLLRAWFTLFITYAIAFNQSFGLTKLGTQSTWSRNFRTIPKALIALFTMSCGEGWNELLIDYTISKPYCIENSKHSECGIKGFAYFLFISWNILSMYVFANLFISLICEACWYVYRSGPVNINERDIVNLLDSWQQLDPKGTGLIRAQDIYNFLGKAQGYFSISIFSRDPKYNAHQILSATQIDARTVVDPYDVDMDAINDYLADMPAQQYREKRILYELFTTQAQLTSYIIPGGRGISFSKLTLMFPLYRDMNPADTLTLKEFIMLKCQLHEAQITLAANFIIRRWRLRQEQERAYPHRPESPGKGYDQSWSHPQHSVYWVS